MKIISCTEAGQILNLTKVQVKELVRLNQLTNYGFDNRFMVSEIEVREFKCK